MIVVVLLALIWGAVLVPPAFRSHRARKKAFEVSFGRAVPVVAPAVEPPPAGQGAGLAMPDRRHSPAVQRRRRIAGGLLTAMIASGLAGLLPTFRVLLIVNLFMDDSFLFYVALLAYRADRRGRAAAAPSVPADTRRARPAAEG
ncbi:MAG: hypothetical protein M3066_03995, partial [Actinomycetota bacterium]|nr:hypothetical protein [Actinomycetota bacterium]